MLLINKKKNKNNFLYFVIILSIAVNYNFFLNTYTLIRSDYHERLISIYGDCEKEGYGFTKLIFDKYDLKYNISSINGVPQTYPQIGGLFYDKNKVLNKNYIILINYKNNPLKEFPNFKILEKKENCYFIKKKN
jgi:hypothetical protein